MPDDPTNPPGATNATEPHGVPTGPVMHIVYVCAIATTAVGLYFGIRYEPTDNRAAVPVSSARHDAPPAAAGVQPALPYADIQRGSLGPNADRQTRLPPGLSLEEQWQLVAPGSDEERHRELAQRASRRAYNGAPPTIPHRVDPVQVDACVACHGPQGMRVGEVVARPMPHAAYASCTQCHVPQAPVLAEELPWLENKFGGLPAPRQGERAWDGAPPTIPHTTSMRTNCASCHGPYGTHGLQSSHPWRTSCTQCHAPSAPLNQQPGALRTDPLFLPFADPTHDD